MAELFKVYTFGGRTHWAKARRPTNFLGQEVPLPEDTTAEDWWHWRSICGRDITGKITESSAILAGQEVDCAQCLRAFEKGTRDYQKLAERFGVDG